MSRPWWAWLPHRAQAAAAQARLCGAPLAAGEVRAYFRCHPLCATISVQQCRANRARFTVHEALAVPFDLPIWWVQPLGCGSCTLALEVEDGRVPFYSADDVLAGRVPREVSAPAAPPARARAPRSPRAAGMEAPTLPGSGLPGPPTLH